VILKDYWEFRQTAQRPLSTSNKTLPLDTVEPPHHCTITTIYPSSLYSGPEKERTNKKLTFNKNQVILQFEKSITVEEA
jgi:hypothetical protein